MKFGIATRVATVLAFGTTLLGSGVTSSAAADELGDRWSPVTEECVVAMRAEPFGAVVVSGGIERRTAIASLTADERCRPSGLAIRERSGSQTNYPLVEGASDNGVHYEWMVSDAPSKIAPRTASCGSTGLLDSSLAFLTSDVAGSPRDVWSVDFRLRPSADCTTASVFRNHVDGSGGPSKASGGCFVAVTSVYEVERPTAGSTSAAFRVAADEACDGPITVTGATEDLAGATTGSRLFEVLQGCNAAPTPITVSVPETDAVATSGMVTERFDLSVDTDCSPGITGRERLGWQIGGLTECGGTSRPSFASAGTVDEMVCAADYTAADANVLRMYQAFFNRYPDTSGAMYWLFQRRFEQITVDDLAFSFATSEEFTTTYGTLDDAEFLTLLYSNMLGRTPDPVGFVYWLDQLTSGLDRHLVVRWIVANDEFVTRYPFTS